MSLIGALTKAAKAGEAAKKTAPFYSAVDEALAAIKRPKGTGAEFYTELTKQAGVKKAELADRKLEQAFKAKGKMTKEEAQQVLQENPPPKLKEKVYDESTAIDEEEIREMVSQEMYGRPYDEIYKTSEMRRILDEVYKRMENNLGTKYGEYKTPDGENYREILLKIPEAFSVQETNRMLKLDADRRRGGLSPEDAQELTALLDKKRNSPKPYYSGHWTDDPNVLAHMRVQDRKGPNGEKILHVEEIQSDWHQEGRKKGYKNEEALNKAQLAFDNYNKDARERMRQLLLKESEGEMAPDRALRFVNQYVDGMDASAVASFLNEKPTFVDLYRATKDVGSTGVPDAPFKKNWHELAMKRLLNYAAENGYDSIALTPGAEQAKRYSLSKQLDEVIFDPNTGHLSGRDHNGKLVVAQRGVTTENLPDYIGKEGAQKILESPLDESGVHALRGADLEVGGEGMKGFYDKMLPDYLNTFGKPYGAQIQMNSTPVSTRDPKSTSWGAGMPGDHPFITVQDLNEPFDGMVELMRRNADTGEETLVGRMTRPESERLMAEELKKLDTFNQIKLHNFPITPEMRESIKQKGLPLYQQVGIPTAGAGAASQMPEPQEEPQYGPGGAITKMALKAAPEPRSPAIMRSSALTNVKSAVRQDKGQYGARRVDRAADEIPNLEKMFKQDALIEAFTGDNAKALMTMNPADFEKYAVQLKSRNKRPTNPSLEDRIRSGEIDKHDLPTDEYIKFLRTLPYGFDDVPFLQIDKQEYGLPLVPSISGHEGRHRSRALADSGEQKSLVRLFPNPELREPLPRRSQEEYIEALKKELEMTGKIVTPEDYGSDKRPPIILPDIYAKGGAVKPKVKDSKSGKVRMTTNRDTMFMELSNKKLKRK